VRLELRVAGDGDRRPPSVLLAWARGVPVGGPAV